MIKGRREGAEEKERKGVDTDKGRWPRSGDPSAVFSLYVQFFAIPWTAAHQASLSMGFFRQEYWSGLPPPPGDLSDPGIELASPALQVDSLPLSHLGSLEVQEEPPIWALNLVPIAWRNRESWEIKLRNTDLDLIWKETAIHSAYLSPSVLL